jgi:hypothetical protein
MKLKSVSHGYLQVGKDAISFLQHNPGVHVPLLNPTTKKEYPSKFQDWIVQRFITAKLFLYYFLFFFIIIFFGFMFEKKK